MYNRVNMALDKVEKNQIWKVFPESSYYSHEIVESNLEKLQRGLEMMKSRKAPQYRYFTISLNH